MRLLLVGGLVLGLALAPAAGRWIDLHVAGGRLKDAWGAVWWHEDWASASPLPAGLDASWMSRVSRPWRIAHALGASGSSAANTLAAWEGARRDGMRLFEVDVWLDEAGVLRCHHGPDRPPPVVGRECTLAELLPLVAGQDGWLILDIKTDFKQTGNSIVRLLQSNGTGRHVVFQLYQPAHTALFAAWATRTPLAEPIVTAYASHRSVQHIAEQADHLHLRALTIPVESLPLLSSIPSGLALLVHPVHDCASWQSATARSAAGIYTLNGLTCVP